MGGGPHPFTRPGPSDATALQPTPDPSGRCPPPPVPPGRRPAVHRRPHRRRPPRGPRRGQAAWNDRIFSPLVTLWVFLGQVLNADHSCRAAVARLIAHRAVAGAAAVLLRDRGLLPGPEDACPRGSSPPWPASSGAEPGRPGRPAVAVEGPPRLPVRRLDGLHARHAGEPARVPAGLQPGPRDELRPGPHRGDHLAGVRGGRRPGRLPLRRQGAGRGQPAPPAVGRAPPRRRPAGRPPDVGLGRHAPAEGARGRHRQPPARRTAGPTSARGRGWARTTTSSSGRSRRRSARWTGRRTTRCPTRSPSARSASGSSSRGSGPGRSWW